MTTPDATPSAANPFSSRHVRPGAVSFLFPAGMTAAKLVEQLRRHGWRGQIVGEHGSGKSALLASLLPAIESAGRPAVLVELRDRQRRLPKEFFRDTDLPSQSVVVIDGYEQLGRWHRFRARRFCRRHGAGLLVTSHAPVKLPELYRTAADLAAVQQLVEQLQRGHVSRVGPEDVAEQFPQHGANVRELLFALYDLYESRRRL